MRKNTFIALLAVLTVLSLTYGYQQKARADEYESIARVQQRLAEEMMVKAREQAQKAEEQMRIAEEQRILAEMRLMEALQREK